MKIIFGSLMISAFLGIGSLSTASLIFHFTGKTTEWLMWPFFLGVLGVFVSIVAAAIHSFNKIAGH